MSRVYDESVTIRQSARKGCGHQSLAVFPGDLSGACDFDDAVVVFISDEYVAVCEEFRAVGRV